MKEKRKFLKTIYDIQKKFHIDFAGVARTFSFGLKPSNAERRKLEQWFDSVNKYKINLYKLIYKDFKRNSKKYLSEKFNYSTFFKGHSLSREKIIKSQPVIEGLRMEINGNMRSFRTNFERIFKENINLIHYKKIKKIKENNNKEDFPRTLLELIKFNKKELQKHDFDYNEVYLTKKLNEFISRDYKKIINDYNSYCKIKKLLEEINVLISDYNYQINLASQAVKNIYLGRLDYLKNLPCFPIIEKENIQNNLEEREDFLEAIQNFSKKKVNSKEVLSWIKKVGPKAKKEENRIKNLNFDKRLAYWINQELENKEVDDKKAVKKFVNALERKIKKLGKHFSKKEYDGVSRNQYLNLLALRARFANPDKEMEINTLRSRIAGSYLKGKAEKEIITLPGFSWKEKPLKNVAFAFKDKHLYICIASSAEPFNISKSGGPITFVKTTGGSKQKAKIKPKEIRYISGNFDINGKGIPLFLKLHFGKSHARRYIFNKNWGVFSNKPRVFLNNARLKRVKINPGDSWQYFLDLTLSGTKIYGFRDFSSGILKQMDAAIGIDRGEVVPIAYAVLDKNNKILEKGLLGKSEYIDKLQEYIKNIKEKQSKNKKISKSLRGKISRLQKTTLETAISQILSLVAKYKAIIAIENLSKGFRGRESKIIPKKTYRKVEDLLSNALNFAGLLRIDNKKKNYWGAFRPVVAGGTSQTCLKCGTQWNSKLYEEIYKYSQGQKFQNLDFKKKELEYKKEKISFNKEWLMYSKKNPFGKKMTINDLKCVIKLKDKDKIEKIFKKAINCRPKQDLFICHKCGFQENADIVGAVNIAKRGIESVSRLLTR